LRTPEIRFRTGRRRKWGIKRRGRLQQAEGQQPGEEEDEECARDGSRRRVRLRIVQGQVKDADSIGPISADCDTSAGAVVSIKVDDGPRPFDDAKGAVGDVGPAEAYQSDAAPARAVVASVALAALAAAMM